MKVAYSWLADWTELPWDARELGARLTMSGFELEALEAAAPPFTGVVVAEIVAAEPHPQADKLQLCRVSTGSGPPLQIVCGASNARAGLKSALALVGGRLPGDVAIGAASSRRACWLLPGNSGSRTLRAEFSSFPQMRHSVQRCPSTCTSMRWCSI